MTVRHIFWTYVLACATAVAVVQPWVFLACVGLGAYLLMCLAVMNA